MSNANPLNIEIFTPENGNSCPTDEVTDFLHEHLDEFGDDRQYIKECIEYSLSAEANKGGYVIVGKEDGKIVGSVVLNLTHMRGYHPPNYLVYIAVHENQRGKGRGRELMNKATEITEGDVALHVEPHNPARHLYDKVGYKSKYLEYRLTK